MRNATIRSAIVALAGTGIAASAASGQILASFSYSTLDSSYDAGTSVLTTVSSGDSEGIFVRELAPIGTAEFDPGDAMFSMSIDVTSIDLGAGTAMGSGTLTITDLDGDTITADVTGDFTDTPIIGSTSVLFFNAVLSDVTFTSDDGWFNGSSSSASVDFSSTGLEVFPGALVRLEITTADFFAESFSGGLAEVDGQIVPAPATAAVLGMGGLIAVRRRRA